MSDPKPVLRKRGGKNCPFYRDKESQATLLASLAEEAIKEAVLEEGLSADHLQIETRYHQGRTEPHTSFGEVKVYDSWRGVVPDE